MRASLVRPSLAAAAALVVLAAACTSGEGDDPSPTVGAEPTTLSVWVSGDAEETQAFVDVAEGFEATQDPIDVEVTQIAERDDLIARLSTAFAGGEPPDLFLMNYRYLGQFESKGAVEPVGPYLDASDTLASDDFYAEAMAVFQVDGEQMCMPQNVSSLVVYYNEDLFDEAGVEPPPAEGGGGTTWSRGDRSSRRTATATGRSMCTASARTRRSSGSRRSSGRTAARSSTTRRAPTRFTIGGLEAIPDPGVPRPAGVCTA